jgi:hypothetical protein
VNVDAKSYAAVTEVCARLAGRLPDSTLGAVRGLYAGGEWGMGDDALLLSLAYDHIGVTSEERDLIRSFLWDPDNPDLHDVPIVDHAPPVSYRFTPTGPAGAPDPGRVDSFLATDAPRRHALTLHRCWRSPLDGAPEAATWLYVLRVTDGTDELKAHSGVTSKLWTQFELKWPVEVLAEGAPVLTYQAAALAGAQLIWAA